MAYSAPLADIGFAGAFLRSFHLKAATSHTLAARRLDLSREASLLEQGHGCVGYLIRCCQTIESNRGRWWRAMTGSAVDMAIEGCICAIQTSRAPCYHRQQAICSHFEQSLLNGLEKRAKKLKNTTNEMYKQICGNGNFFCWQWELANKKKVAAHTVDCASALLEDGAFFGAKKCCISARTS